jgi:hypothetical protein
MAPLLARLRMPLRWLSVLLLVGGPFLDVPVWPVLGSSWSRSRLPMRFDHFEVSGSLRSGVPGSRQPFVVRPVRLERPPGRAGRRPPAGPGSAAGRAGG